MTDSEVRARRFARGETDRDETAEIVDELLLEEPPSSGAESEPECRPAAADYDEALAAAERLSVDLADLDADERRRAVELVAAVEAIGSEDRRREAVESDPRFHRWTVVDLLCQRSMAECATRPARCLELARLAVAASERVPAGPESRALRAELQAMARAQLGNAERIVGDLRGAERTLRDASAQLNEGTGDPLPRARVLSLIASLRGDQSRFDEAVDLAARAARLYRRAGDSHAVGRTLIKLASYHAYRDEPEVACTRLDQAMAYLDLNSEPRLLFAVRQNRASYLERAGRLDEAAAELALAESLAEATLDRVRVGWLSGRLALRRGDAAAGERALLRARSDFVAHGLGYEAAQVSLELAALYAEQGRCEDQRRLARAMVPLFAARDVHAEARAALMLYCDAVRTRAASANFAREVAAYLERASGRPALAFRSAGD